jgi:hypothetical protein
VFYNGIEFIESKACTKGTIQVSKKINKSKRIQKKWNKKYGYDYIAIPNPDVYIFEGKCIGHPKTLKKIIKKINKSSNPSIG